MTTLPHNAVFLDAGSMGADLSLRPLQQLLANLHCHDHTLDDEVSPRIADAELVIVNKVKLGERHFKSSPKLKLICLTATGSDNIDLDAAHKRGITVCNIVGYSVNAVPQHALALMLMLATRAHQYNDDVRSGQWSKSRHFSLLHHRIVELKGKTLGIAGFGALGRQLARLVDAFDMTILTCNLPGQPPRPERLALHAMLPQVDFLSLHCPLTAQTAKMLSTREFELMKPGAYLINTARGQLIDEPALAAALKQGEIAGAAIDVLSQEPPPPGHPLLGGDIPNLIITPHNAWGSLESRQQLMAILLANIRGFFAGKPQNVIPSQ